MEEITEIPNTAEYIEGIINLRGKIVVVVDLASKVGLTSKENDMNTRIIVIEVDGNTVGMIVDTCNEVLRLDGNNIEAAPSIITRKINADYIEGVGILDERLLILLDLKKVLAAKEVEHVKEVGKISAKKHAGQADKAGEQVENGKSQAQEAVTGKSKTPKVETEKEPA